MSCIHLVDGDGMRCDAYPQGIPDEILESEVDHRLPYAGDGGVQFEQNPERLPPDLIAFEGEP